VSAPLTPTPMEWDTIKNPKVRAAMAKAEAARMAEEAAAIESRARQEYISSNTLYFDFPYNFCKDENFAKVLRFKDGKDDYLNKFRFMPEIKVYYCKNTKQFREWAKSEENANVLKLPLFVIKNIDEFRHKRKTKYRESYEIKFIMSKLNLSFNDAIAHLKRIGYFYDGVNKKWYKQY
jgi:hypothetical protein